MEFQLNIIGILLMILAIFHIGFPKYFKWKEELKSLSLINKQMMEVHTIFIGITVFLMGLLCITSSEELITTELGKRISFGFGIFWTMRLIFQLFIYSSKLWKGKTFETVVHIIFTLLWIHFSVIFFEISFS